MFALNECLPGNLFKSFSGGFLPFAPKCGSPSCSSSGELLRTIMSRYQGVCVLGCMSVCVGRGWGAYTGKGLFV